jgi:hypothetical protein
VRKATGGSSLPQGSHAYTTTAVRTIRRLLPVLAAAAVAVPAAHASVRVVAGARDVSLHVRSNTTAVISYTWRGKRWTVTACCALNTRFPEATGHQVHMRLTYRSLPFRQALGSCGRYDGPELVWLVTACKAPDGSYWALQQWDRMLPNYGLQPTPTQAAPELRLSHWRGALAKLTVNQDWAYRGRFDHLYGSLTYRGQPMHGFATGRHGEPLDRFGALVYVDTLDSAYGPGWRRENGFVTHRPTGIFCYGFFPHGAHPSGRGTAYRATAVGPGGLPDLFWQGAVKPYDPAADQVANEQQARSFSDRLCRPN